MISHKTLLPEDFPRAFSVMQFPDESSFLSESPSRIQALLLIPHHLSTRGPLASAGCLSRRITLRSSLPSAALLAKAVCSSRGRESSSCGSCLPLAYMAWVLGCEFARAVGVESFKGDDTKAATVPKLHNY